MEENLHKLYRCEKHPKYKGKHKPKHECVVCLNIYIAKHNKPRAPIKPTQVIRDKSKYTRKNKHKKSKDDL